MTPLKKHLTLNEHPSVSNVPFETTVLIHRNGKDKCFLHQEKDKRITLNEIVDGYPKMVKFKQQLQKSFLEDEEG